VISAQGMESGGFSGGVSALALVPQVVDAVQPIPVIASGGIPEAWKQRIVEARSEDAVKVEFADLVMPAPTAGGYPTLPRSLRTPFVDRWNSDPAAAEREADRLRGEVDAAMTGGRAHELVPLTGQSAGMITEILPAAEIIGRMVAEAEAALRSAEPFLG
jgi:enoyl-[acyl-carrier protein] reductase II